jgi:lysophospholipase L1-like esterase
VQLLALPKLLLADNYERQTKKAAKLPSARFLAQCRADDAATSGPRGGFNSWQQQFDHTKALAASHSGSGLVFIGDSVTQNWGAVNGREVVGSGADVWNAVAYDYARFDALNFGIAGDQTQNVIYRIDHGQFDGLNPGLVVLMIGTNNCFAPESNSGFPIADYAAPAHTAEQIADGILATVPAIHRKLPNSHILVLSAIRGLNNGDPDRIAMDRTNAILSRAFATDTNPVLDYLDISGRYRNPDGTINDNIGGDGIHFTSTGYATSAKAIAPYGNQYATVNRTHP